VYGFCVFPRLTCPFSRNDKNRNGRDDGAKEHAQTDHMLLSSRLFSHIKSVWVDHSYNATDIAGHWPLIVEMTESLNVMSDVSSMFVRLVRLCVC
jgi:hypothetical protein